MFSDLSGHKPFRSRLDLFFLSRRQTKGCRWGANISPAGRTALRGGLWQRRSPQRSLVQDVDDPISPRVDKNGLTVDYGVTIVAYSVLWRNIVICNLSAGQNSSYRKAVSVVVGWMMLTAYIFMEAWALINPE
jgi:hypothetical protein